MPLFRKSTPEDPLIVSMTGVRLGERVLIVAGDAVDVPLDVAARVGLSGQASVLAPAAQTVERVVQAAQRRGVLLEPTVLEIPMPYGDASFDLVIVDSRSRAGAARSDATLLGEARRMLRLGGRLVVVTHAPGRPRLFSHRTTGDAGALHELLEQLRAAGFRAVRSIGTRAGSTFVEALRSV